MHRPGGGDPAPRFGAALLALAVLGSCAPEYQTSYRLDMPRPLSEEARQCLARCDRARDACFVPARDEFAACTERALMVQDQCRANAQIEYQICQRAYAPTGQDCYHAACDRPVCDTPAFALCETDYRRCFADCGGTVVEDRRCVANCPS
ncbi:MAG: hypothetical protein AB7I59_19755 [Geminicoccaceae bacterium]